MKPGGQAGWTQSELAAKLQSDRRDISHSLLGEIEACEVGVCNFEPLDYREVFGKVLKKIFPANYLETAPLDIKAANEETTGPPEGGPET
jgi:hypothetical protein